MIKGITNHFTNMARIIRVIMKLYLILLSPHLRLFTLRANMGSSLTNSNDVTKIVGIITHGLVMICSMEG